jgi:ABC-type nitrate/sulfonate/bicarbonate transport system substrate-binding protein
MPKVSLPKTTRVGRLVVLGLSTAIVLAGCGAATQSKTSTSSVRHQLTPVSVGWTETAVESVEVEMARLAPKYGLRIALSQYETRPLQAAAIEAGRIEFGTVTPPDVVGALALGDHNLVVLAGLANGADELLCRTGVNVSSWSQLTGPNITIRTFSGGIGWLKFIAGLDAHHINPRSLPNYSTLTGTSAELTTLLRTGNTDVEVNNDPYLEEAIAGGYGHLCSLNINDTPIGPSNGIFATSLTMVKQHPATVQKVVDLYVATMDKLRSSPSLWASVYNSFAGQTRQFAEASFKHESLTLRISLKDLQNAAQLEYGLGLVTADVAAQVPSALNLSFAADASKKTVAYLES